MAQKHGNKNYYQVLIDPHRSKLIEKIAKEADMRGTAWVREAAYEKLQKVMNTGEYNIAKAKDDLLWKQSVQRRIEGRKSEED